MVALNCFQVSETAYGQPLLVLLAPIDHSVNMLCQNFSCL